MSRTELLICYREGLEVKTRCSVNKWKFQDTMMGEQYLSFNVTSSHPIDWAVGDYCVFRGETYTLNYIPSLTQRARTGEVGDSYTYDNVKMESRQEELVRCLMLDITPTTEEYISAYGTNYTGSSIFQLFCGEVSVNGSTLTPVCALVSKMQANLDRMYGRGSWAINVDVTNTHTEDKVLSFDNWSVAQALAEVHNTFDLDYCVRGRNIYIGYNLKNLTSDNEDETFAFGYGKGYNTREDMNHGLFQIKRIANSQQQIVTRLRVLGSTRNLPYRYYNKKYSKGNDDLSQTLFPTNLQLPDTFESPAVKAQHNAQRDSSFAHVKGDTNDAYIDKNNDATTCQEGVRESSVRFDGSNSNLQEIYPTIENATYEELRTALVSDQDGNVGGDGTSPSSAFYPYANDERIDKLLAVGYMDGANLIDDANKGSGIMAESGDNAYQIVRTTEVASTSLRYKKKDYGDFYQDGVNLAGNDNLLFNVQGVTPGEYAMSPTHGVVYYSFRVKSVNVCRCDVGYKIVVNARNVQTGSVTHVATYISDFTTIASTDGVLEMELPEIPDIKRDEPTVPKMRVINLSDIIVHFIPLIRNVYISGTNTFNLEYRVGKSRLNTLADYTPEYTWFPIGESGNVSDQFHVFIQDMGFGLQACWSDDTPKMAMKSGRCVGREFEIGSDVQKVTYNGKKGYMLTLKRSVDTSLNIYYPSQTDPIAAGDFFVLLGISMPDAYVKMAEVRLLKAATDYLSDNSETQFVWQPYIDDIYLQRNLDRCRLEGREQDSIWWRLYAGLKFTFIADFDSQDGGELASLDITIEKVTISMGEGLTPKVDLTLNDNVQQSTLQKLITSVDRIYNGSLFNTAKGGGGSSTTALMSLLQNEGGKMFLSKKNDDTALGRITFKEGLKSDENAEFGKYLRSEESSSNTGAAILPDGTGDFLNLKVIDKVLGNLFIQGNIEATGNVRAAQAVEAAQILFSNVLKSIGAIAGERGIYMDAQKGTVQAEGMDVLGWLRVETLEYNNVRLMGQDFIFSEGGDVERVEIIDEDQKLYLLHIHKEKEGKHVEFADNDILYGQVDQLENNGLYYTSWCHVIPYDSEHSGVTLNDGMTPDTVRVQLFPNDAVPGGYNDVPVVHMTLAHRGNTENAERQQLWELSTTNKRIQFLWHVDAPKLRDENYALVWGILPQLGFFPTTLDYSMPSLFAGGLVVDHQHIHHVNYPVPTDYIIRDKGDWVQPAADSEGYRHGVVDYADGRKEAVTDQLKHNGFTWRCVVDHTKQEPSVNGSDWVAVGGGSDGKDGKDAISVGVLSDKGDIIKNGEGTRILIAVVRKGGEDITSTIANSAFSWKRTSAGGYSEWDAAWNSRHEGVGPSITVTAEDVMNNAVFTCEVKIEV